MNFWLARADSRNLYKRWNISCSLGFDGFEHENCTVAFISTMDKHIYWLVTLYLL